MSYETSDFIKEISLPHRRINPCFMNGKGCVYTEHIDREIENRRTLKEENKNEKDKVEGFMILPFQPNVLTFFELCLKKYICDNYSTENQSFELLKADQVRRTGYVICEKICKKIQESDYIIVDVSIPNANVFYELGLAYGIDQKIILVHHKNSLFGSKIVDYFSETGCRAYIYNDLDSIKKDEFPISNYIWKRDNKAFVDKSPDTLILDDLNVPLVLNKDIYYKPVDGGVEENCAMPDDIDLDFATHVKAAISVAIDNIVEKKINNDAQHKIPKSYYDQIRELRAAEVVKKNANFVEMQNKIDRAFCTIIKTGGVSRNPMVYFWLGYCHAIGKNVIPITMLEKGEDDIDDLAFDIRALWHLTFYKDSPRELEGEVEEILYQMILNDFSEWSRKRFWDEILQKRGKVSVFTGALHNTQIGREMIGDWDLRAASELTSYFASHQYRATIESPIYQIEHVLEQEQVDKEIYIEELEKMLKDKNCIVIASPDVNPMTEIVLGKIYGLKREQLFNLKIKVEGRPNAVLAIKEVVTEKESSLKWLVERTFYREKSVKLSKRKPSRGFKASFLTNHEIMGQFVSQTDISTEFTVHAHLAIIENPFSDSQDADGEKKYIILLNGVSGPATFALTHVLTGGVSDEFVSYANGFNAEFHSEDILSIILEDLNAMRDKKEILQYIIEVTVGPPKKEIHGKDKYSRNIFDWRHIHSWKLIQTHNRSFKEQ